MHTHFKTKTQPWLVRAALMMVAPMIGCDPGGDTEDLADEADGESDADEGDDVEFRGSLGCLRPAYPASDVSTTLAGAVTTVTREGSGTGNGCDFFTVRVATPSGHRAREIVIEGGLYNAIVDANAYAWKRTCTDPHPGIPQLCTTWQTLSLDPLDSGGNCYEGPQIHEGFCIGSVSGGGDIPANSYDDILVAARVESEGGTSLPVEITVSE